MRAKIIRVYGGPYGDKKITMKQALKDKVEVLGLPLFDKVNAKLGVALYELETRGTRTKGFWLNNVWIERKMLGYK
jgi:hypothetical protein